MTQYTTSMDLADMLSIIEDAPDQKNAIHSYMTLNAGLQKFLTWYNEYDPSEVVGLIDYKQDVRAHVQLITCLSDLSSLRKYSIENQVKLLNRIMSKVSPESIMLMENCLTGDLKEYYPGINWELFAEFGVPVR